MIRRVIPFVVVFSLTTVLYAKKTSVAVVNFTNNTGKAGLNFLSNTLAESVSSKLAENKSLKVVERTQLKKVLNEIELQQSGLFDPDDVAKVGRFSKAQYIVVGTYSGTSSKITVTLKAVRVESGDVKGGRTLHAKIDNIFDQVGSASASLGNVISGKGLGKLTVTTKPSGASVYVDGLFVGESPVKFYKLPAGDHEVKAIKEGYLEDESSISISIGEEESVNLYLAENKVQDKGHITAGGFYMVPQVDESAGGPGFFIAMGMSFNRVWLGLEYAYAGMGQFQYSHEIKSPFGAGVNQQRRLSFHMLNVNFDYVLLHRVKYFAPYMGAYAGLNSFQDFLVRDIGDVQKGTSHRFGFGGKFGINFLPYSKFTLFIEGRYHYHLGKIKRTLNKANGLFGDVEPDRVQEFTLHGPAVFGGLSIYF